MCTLTFVAAGGKFIVTHNRDEQTARPSAIEPKRYLVNNTSVFFPKDPKAGGTWFAVATSQSVLVLLNGADEKHQILSNYRKSRGLIVLDLMTAKSVIDQWLRIDLDGIEPFTSILFEKGQLVQLQWNGTNKLEQKLDTNKPYIWSSATLYSKQIREQRAKWFQLFLEQNKNLDENDLINFHRNTETNNNENGLIINRNDVLKTLSVTQYVIESKKSVLHYYDLIANKQFSTTILTS